MEGKVNNRYIYTLPDGIDIDIRKIVMITDVRGGVTFNDYFFFIIGLTGNMEVRQSFKSQEEAAKQRMALLEKWYSTAAEDAVKSGVFDYETRNE
jgi:hypothetical protein